MQIEKNIYKPIGSHTIELNISNIYSGVYYLVLNASGEIHSAKVYVIK